MKEPHHQRIVGYSMILVSASLVAIALLYLAIGENVLYADEIVREKEAIFQECKSNGFQGEQCAKFVPSIILEQCVKNKDLESPECFQYRTAVQSAIFEECRALRDVTSPLCQQYEGSFPLEPPEEELEETEENS